MRQFRFLILAVGTLLLAGLPAAALAEGPQLQVTAPTAGAMVDGTNVTLTFQVSDFKVVPSTVPLAEAGKHPEANRSGEGHLHLMLDLQPLVVWEHTDPYTFTNVPAGEHQLMVELVNNDHSSLSPQVIQTVRFNTTGVPIGPQTLAHTGAPQQATIAGVLLILAGLLLIAGWGAGRITRRATRLV